jgi:hypothetical protein
LRTPIFTDCALAVVTVTPAKQMSASTNSLVLRIGILLRGHGRFFDGCGGYRILEST